MTVPSDPPVDRYIEAGGGLIHFLEWPGDGPPAHLLHANGFCAGVYKPFVDRLTGPLHMFASDVRGHGETRFPTSPPVRHWQSFAEDLVLLVERALSPPILGIGHSLGAASTFMAAALRPDLFSGLVLIDPVILPKRYLLFLRLLKLFGQSHRFPLAKGARRRKNRFSSRTEALERFAGGRGLFATWNRDFIESYVECGLTVQEDSTAVLSCDPEVEARIYETVPLDVWSYAPRVQCPVLAVRGERSDTFLPLAATRLSREVRNCEVITIPDAGHFVPMEQPEVCAKAVLDFAARIARE